MNILPDVDGTIGVDVGEIFRHDLHPFSPLLPRDGQPHYTPVEGSTDPLQWPGNWQEGRSEPAQIVPPSRSGQCIWTPKEFR